MVGSSVVRRGGIEARMKDDETLLELVKESDARPPTRMSGFWDEFDVRVKDLSWLRKDSILENAYLHGPARP